MIKKEVVIKDKNIINIKLRCSTINTTSDTYEFKMGNFESSPLEEILQLLTKFDKTVVGEGTSSTVRKIASLSNLIWGKALKEFDLIAANFRGMTTSHIQETRKGLLKYFLLNTLLQELNNILPKFTGSDKYSKITQ